MAGADRRHGCTLKSSNNTLSIIVPRGVWGAKLELLPIELLALFLYYPDYPGYD